MRAIRTSCLVLLLACRSDAEPETARVSADSAAGEIEFRYAGPNETAIVVPVHINGEGPFDFVLDTGATLTCVDDQLRAKLQLPDVPGTISLGAGIGEAGRFELARIDSFRVGSAVVTKLTACVLDLTRFRQIGVDIHGLVGLNLLKQFRVSIDFDNRNLSLQR